MTRARERERGFVEATLSQFSSTLRRSRDDQCALARDSRGAGQTPFRGSPEIPERERERERIEKSQKRQRHDSKGRKAARRRDEGCFRDRAEEEFSRKGVRERRNIVSTTHRLHRILADKDTDAERTDVGGPLIRAWKAELDQVSHVVG